MPISDADLGSSCALAVLELHSMSTCITFHDSAPLVPHRHRPIFHLIFP